jgi:hypothetical protein
MASKTAHGGIPYALCRFQTLCVDLIDRFGSRLSDLPSELGSIGSSPRNWHPCNAARWQ